MYYLESVIEIKRALSKSIKNSYPSFDVFFEEIYSVKNEKSKKLDNYFFIDITPVNIETVNEYHTKFNVLIDIWAETKDKGIEEYIKIAGEVDKLLRPIFRFGDRQVTINESDFKIVDKVLKYKFYLNFIESMEEDTSYPMMEELERRVY